LHCHCRVSAGACARFDLALAARLARDVAHAASSGRAGVRVHEVACPGVAAAQAGVEIGRAVRSVGFETLHAAVRPVARALRQILSRHLVVWCEDNAQEREAAAWWARALASHSPRSHLIVVLCAAAPRAPRRPRARSPTAADWWIRHALRSARALIDTLELERAEALLAGAVAEVRLRRLRAPAALSARHAELCFWQGRRVESGMRHSGAPDAETVWWTALSAWTRGDVAGFSRGLIALESSGARDRAQPLRVAALRSLRIGSSGASDRRRRPALFRARRDDTLAREAALGRAAAAAGALAAGDRVQARQWLSARADLPPLYALLYDWLAARTDAAGDRLAGLAVRARQHGACGITRWGRTEETMAFVEGLPALLQLVQDADDELAALAGGCAWIRRHTGADRVGIVDRTGASLIATDGWTRSDLSSPDVVSVVGKTAVAGSRDSGLVVVSAPMRYGRVVIGHVLARGCLETRAALEQAAQTLAALTAPALRSRLDALAVARDAHAKAPEILGRSGAIGTVREAIGRAAGTAFPVLIEGESGTGKELVARALHRLSPRRDRPFAAINCAALTDELIEAELFGHTRGAFTGAIGHRVGLFEQAHGGTLFLDEVSELSARAQAKLLRVLQEREIRRLGENVTRAIDVRLVAATNVSLAEAATRGAFREDLRFRLAVVPIRVPPLRDRVEDVPLLAQAFWRQALVDTGKRAGLAPDALATLCRYPWPGNVRELQNVMSALAVIAPVGGRVSSRHVSQALGSVSAGVESPGVPLDAAKRLFEQRMIASALARHGGRRSAAARELGLTRQGLTKALRRLGLCREEDSLGVA
jgi:DNA-binding NtrC family response regulator